MDIDLDFYNCKLINLPEFGDSERGLLTFFQFPDIIPFEIKRVYFIHGIGDLSKIRGPHAHKDTEQVFITIQGESTYHLDDGTNKKSLVLSNPNRGILIGSKVWHYMDNFSKDTIFLVLASSVYDEKDYLRNYDDFLDYIKI